MWGEVIILLWISVEASLYIQAFDEEKPKFTVGGWTPLDGTIELAVQEERPIGSTLFQLAAIDPTTNEPITRYSLIPPLPSLVTMDTSGAIHLAKRIDYEFLKEKVWFSLINSTLRLSATFFTSGKSVLSGGLYVCCLKINIYIVFLKLKVQSWWIINVNVLKVNRPLDHFFKCTW